jgi:hypothetical protein
VVGIPGTLVAESVLANVGASVDVELPIAGFLILPEGEPHPDRATKTRQSVIGATDLIGINNLGDI